MLLYNLLLTHSKLAIDKEKVTHYHQTLTSSVCWNTRLYMCSILYDHLASFHPIFLFFFNGKFISWVRFENVEHIKINSKRIKRGILEVLWPMENSLEFVCRIPKGLLWRKLMFHSLFLFVLIDTVSVSLLFEHIFFRTLF